MKLPYTQFPREIRALVVDDDEISRTFFETFLTRYFNCEVMTAENGNHAVETMDSFEPDIIFLDILMPIMNGFEFLNHLKQQTGSRSIPVVVVSAVENRETIRKIKNMGVKDYFLKPFPLEYVRSRICNIIADTHTPAKVAELN